MEKEYLKVQYSPYIDSLLKILEEREKPKAQQTERENFELKLKRKGNINKKYIKTTSDVGEKA